MRRWTGRRRWLVLGVVVAVVVGVLAIWVFDDRGAGSSAFEDELLVTAPVGRGSLEETVVTRGVVGHAQVADLRAGVDGRLTGLEVGAGDVVEAGDVLWRVNGRPAVAAAGEVPFWRELALGDQGPDVTQLQQILSDQGAPVEVTGQFGEATVEALRAWQGDHGYVEPDGAFRPGDVVVAPLPARIGARTVDVGAYVEPSSVIVEASETVTSVAVELNPSDRVRIEAGDPARVVLSATGDRADGQVQVASLEPSARDDGSVFYPATVMLDDAAFEQVDGAQAQVTIVVATADDVLTVPLAAVVNDADGQPAVRVTVEGQDGRDDRVEVVPVELGLSQGSNVEIRDGLDGTETVVVAGGGTDES